MPESPTASPPKPKSAAAPTKPHQTIQSIQVMRGVAALSVAIYHTHLILGQPEYGGYTIFADLTSRGWMGVNLFFILSGFIIMFAHARDIGNPSTLPLYGWRRFVRVYPVYWIFLIIYMAAAAAGMGSVSYSMDAVNMASVFSLIRLTPDLSLPLQVAWTLFYEVQFYAVFALLIFNRMAGIAAFALWLVGILIGSLVFGTIDAGPLHMWNIYFFFGLGVYHLHNRIAAKWGVPILLSGIAAFALAYIFIPDSRVSIVQKEPVKLLMLALPFAAIVLGGAVAERNASWQAPKSLLLLGSATYSIYIVHSAVISLIAILNKKFGHGMVPPAALFVLTAAASIGVGVVVHLLVEKPLLELLRSPKWLPRPRPWLTHNVPQRTFYRSAQSA